MSEARPPAANTRLRKKRIGSIGVGVRISQMTNNTSSTTPPPVLRIGRCGAMNRQRSPTRPPGPSRHARLMKPEAVTVTGIDTCSPDGCARLCTENGMAAAHAAHHAGMLARARRIVVDPNLAEDVVQEAFLRAWRACSTFDPAGGPLANWLLAITANTSVDMVKARMRRPPLASGSADEDASPAGINDIDLLVLRSQLRQALSAIEAHHGTRWSRRSCATVPMPMSPPSSALRPVPCAPGSTTGFGGCAACSRHSRQRTRLPEPGRPHLVAAGLRR